MNTIRQEMTKRAKKQGLCTQCLKHPASDGRVQCQRCIDTNRRKYRNKQVNKELCKSVNPYRLQVIEFAVAHNICTKCFGESTTGSDFRKCQKCRSSAHSVKKVPKKVPKPIDKEKHREYNRKHRAKKLYEKVRKLDQIKHAVEKAT